MKDIIILGCGISHFECPYDTEVWSVNAAVRWAEGKGRKLDILFFFDDLESFDPYVMTLGDLVNTNARLISTQKNADFGKQFGLNIEVYPIDDIIKQFNTVYFSNSISYMIAYAIHRGDINKISMYGVDHMTWSSYVMERCGVEYWVGRAEGAGIEVEIAKGSALCKTLNDKLYGYEFQYDKNARVELLTNSQSERILIA